MFGRLLRSGKAHGGSGSVAKHSVDLEGYRKLLQQVGVELGTGRASEVGLHALPDGTFAVTVTGPAGAPRTLHVELHEGGRAACPHCLVLYSLPQLARLLRAADPTPGLAPSYLAALEAVTVPRIVLTTGAGGAPAVALERTAPPDGVMPFTGGCQTHARDGR